MVARSLLLLALLAGLTVEAQEEPFRTVQKFDTNIPRYRTNVCDRQQKVIEGTLNLTDALEGLDLTVAITNYPFANEDKFFTLKDNKIPNPPGLFAVLLDELARRGKFSWRNTFVAIDPLNGNDVNKTWTDLLIWEVEHFDIAADYWARSAERMARGVSFPSGWYDGSIILVQDSGVSRANFWKFLEPFQPSVWLLIVAAILFTGLSYFMLERLNVRSDERELEDKPMAAIFLASLTFTGHFEFWPDTNPARLLSFSWTFWALIITSAYTANMASFLVSRNGFEKPIVTFEDAIRQNAPICIQANAVLDEWIKTKYPDLVLVRKETEAEIFGSLKLPWRDGGCAAALTNLGTFEIYSSSSEVNAGCTLTTEKHVLQSLPAGFATAVDTGNNCTSLISHVLNIHLRQMKPFIQQEWEKHIQSISTTGCQGKKIDPNRGVEGENFSLRLDEMAGIFIVHVALSGLALLIAMFDLRERYMTNKEASLELRAQDASDGDD